MSAFSNILKYFSKEKKEIGNIEEKSTKNFLTSQTAINNIFQESLNSFIVHATPSSISSVISDAMQGYMINIFNMYQTMYSNDLDLSAAIDKRVGKYAINNWSIGGDKKRITDENKQFAKDFLESIENFDETKEYIADAIPKGFAVLEKIWDISPNGDWKIKKYKQIDQRNTRLGIPGIKPDLNDVRLIVTNSNDLKYFKEIGLTQKELNEASTNGLSIETNPILKTKFLVVKRKIGGNNLVNGCLLRQCVFPYFFKTYDWKWFMNFAEQMLGIKLGKVANSNSEGKMLTLLENMTNSFNAVIGKDDDIQFIQWLQGQTSANVYDNIDEKIKKMYSKKILGHESVQSSVPNKLGNSSDIMSISYEVQLSDSIKLDEVYSREIRNLFILNIGEQEYYPYFKSDIPDVSKLSLEIDIDKNLKEMGFPLNMEDMSERYNRPLTKENKNE